MRIRTKIMLAIMIFSCAFSQKLHIEEKTKFADQLKIKLNRLKGQIVIKGWDKNLIQVTGDHKDEDKIVRLEKSSSGFSLQIKNNSGYYDDDRLATKLTIMLPKKYNLYIDTNSELIVENLEGNFELDIANDNMELIDLKGKADVSVANGTLTISGSSLEGEFNNVNGNLRVTDSDLIGEVGTTNANMVLSRAPKGLKAKSTNGNITIESVNDFARIKTTNGSLKIGQLNGSLDFDSTNGSVSLEMIGNSQSGDHSLNINTLNGSVDLVLPENFSMAFDIEIEEQNSYQKKDYTVTSDFSSIEVNVSGLDDDEDYEVKAKGKINEGKQDATMRIVNGNVRIKKSRK